MATRICEWSVKIGINREFHVTAAEMRFISKMRSKLGHISLEILFSTLQHILRNSRETFFLQTRNTYFIADKSETQTGFSVGLTDLLDDLFDCSNCCMLEKECDSFDFRLFQQ